MMFEMCVNDVDEKLWMKNDNIFLSESEEWCSYIHELSLVCEWWIAWNCQGMWGGSFMNSWMIHKIHVWFTDRLLLVNVFMNRSQKSCFWWTYSWYIHRQRLSGELCGQCEQCSWTFFMNHSWIHSGIHSLIKCEDAALEEGSSYIENARLYP